VERIAITFILLAAALPVRAQQQGAPDAAPGPIFPNESRVTAIVRARKVWPPGSLDKERPFVPQTKTHWSVALQVLTATPGESGLQHFAQADKALEAFSDQPIPEGIVEQKIAATLTLTGDTRGTRWVLKEFQLLPGR
jgi:hypothetical protein